jgi:hypothetical protein
MDEVEHDEIDGFADCLTVLVHAEDRACWEQDPALDGGRNSPERADHDVLLHIRECASRLSA